MMENITSIFDSFISKFLFDELRSNRNKINSNNNLKGGTMSDEIIRKLSQNFNSNAILQINNVNNMYGGDIVFTSLGPVDYGPNISPFGLLIDNPFDPFPFGIPPPVIGVPPPIIGVSPPVVGISSPLVAPVFSEPRVISVPSSYKGIEINNKLINIYYHLMTANYAEHLTGSLKIPSIGYEYMGTVKLIKEYLIRAKQASDGIPYSSNVSSTTSIPTSTTTVSSPIITQLKGLLPQIDNQKNTLNAHKFTLAHVNVLLTSITQLQTIMQNSNPTYFQNIINHCNNAINQLQIINTTLNTHNIGTVPADSATNAILAIPGTAAHISLEARLNAVAIGPPVVALAGPPYLLPANVAANMAYINADPIVTAINNIVNPAYNIIDNSITNIKNEINKL